MGTTRQKLLEECFKATQFSLAQTGEEVLDDKQLSPAGRPPGCCRIQTVSALDREQGTPTNALMCKRDRASVPFT